MLHPFLLRLPLLLCPAGVAWPLVDQRVLVVATGDMNSSLFLRATRALLLSRALS
eukprot:COSAG03_NODE_2776_length_2458_cov_1.309029_2_plen_55_part_00